jgi:hypothetical protein
MSRFTRISRTILLSLLALAFIPMFIGGADLQYRALSLAGFASSLYGLRIVHGPTIEVRADGLTILKHWPFRRDLRWYQIFEVEVIPGYWMLSIELNSGERIDLPCVEDVDKLFEDIEERRHLLDA